jgi:hypothetical protein
MIMSTEDIYEGSFAEFVAGESYVSPSEKRWLKWVRPVERLAGLKTLDGDQEADGYSLDYAHDAFMDGLTVAEYVAEINENRLAAFVAANSLGLIEE